MGSTIQLNITVPSSAAGFPQEGTGHYSQGIQLHLSITMPMTPGTAPLVQTMHASPRPTPYIDNDLTEREADLRQALKQRRLNNIAQDVVASVPGAVSVAASLHPAPSHNRAGSEGTSTDTTLCSNGSHPSGNHYDQIVEDEPIVDQKYSHAELSRSVPVIDRGRRLQQQETIASDSGHRVQPHTPPGSPYRLRSASPQSEHRHPRAERGRSRESKIITHHRDASPYSCQSRDYSSARSSSPSYQSRRPHSPTRQSGSASRCSSRSSSASLAVSHHVEEEDPVQQSPLILRVNTRVHEDSTRTTHESSEPLSHRIGYHPNHRRICPFFHKNEEDRHPNHEPHPGYSEEEFDNAVKLYARGDDLPQSLVKKNVEINWKNHKRNFSQSPTQSTSSPVKRRFERPAQRPSFTTSDNFERPNKRQRLVQQPYELRDQGPPRYDANPHDPYPYGREYIELPEYSPSLSPPRQQFSSPNDSRQQYRSDYFTNAPSRGVYERPQGVRPHWQ